jgi:large subunit ribosomal protein L15
MKLHTLPTISGALKAKKRRGKGPGSGNGKTAGRGHKGNKARSGYRMPTNFSGIPYFRRLPQRGFNNYDYRKAYDPVSLQDIEALRGVDVIDRLVLVQAGLLRSSSVRFKVLGALKLSVSRPLTVHADAFSASAKAAIEQAGGKAVVTQPEEVQLA